LGKSVEERPNAPVSREISDLGIEVWR